MPHRRAESSVLSRPLRDRLKVYVAAAGAACGGILAASGPATAQVIYKPAHIVIPPRTTYDLDLNQDFSIDFTFTAIVGRLAVEPNAWVSPFTTFSLHNGALVSASNRYQPLALKRGSKIGRSRSFWPPVNHSSVAEIMARAAASGEFGHFANVKDRYLGLRFCSSDGLRYGWARFTVHVDPTTFAMSVLLSGYAYQNTPNEPILAGQTSGTVANPSFDSEPLNSEAPPGLSPEQEPISQFVPRAPLGVLALGAQALPIWRRTGRATA